ncbi:MAG: hypothetical protein MUF72_04760 [Elainella sp. Prado103]|jgi:hypothetical protein|nr:hypothetical protein [Elainella sp. Prado103]
MNAQPQHDPTAYQANRPPKVRMRPRQRHAPQQIIAVEAAIKLSVNLVLGVTAIVTLHKLIPVNLQQQADLQRLRAEVAEAQTKVAALEEDFDRHFDPQQALNIMQEQNIRFNPKQRQVVWLDPKVKQAADPTADPLHQADTAVAAD